MTLTTQLRVYKLGLIAYDEALKRQLEFVERLKANDASPEEFLLLLEHPPVITIGRSGTSNNVRVDELELKRQDVILREASRGGDVTYHGPGQLVGYPILRLDRHGKDVHKYMRSLEAVIIAVLKHFGIVAQRRSGLTGVWVEDRKIASIGVAVTRWISYHGFALNVAPNLKHFDLIHPCGLKGVAITSMAKELGRPLEVKEVQPSVIHAFAEEFHFDPASLVDTGIHK
jgi:lipoate-protein ligase B